jgi:hypothetical protein
MKITFTAFIIIAMIVLLLKAPAFASDEACAALSRLGAKVMQLRQANADMADVLVVAGKSPNPAVVKILRAIVRDAYDQPRYDTKELQVRLQQDFANEIMASCLREYEGTE